MITVTILPILSILFSRVTVNIMYFFCFARCVFHVIVYIVMRYLYDARRRDFALSASFVLRVSFDVSEVTTRTGNESIVQKENCLVEEIKEVKLRSRRGKIY